MCATPLPEVPDVPDVPCCLCVLLPLASLILSIFPMNVEQRDFLHLPVTKHLPGIGGYFLEFSCHSKVFKNMIVPEKYVRPFRSYRTLPSIFDKAEKYHFLYPGCESHTYSDISFDIVVIFSYVRRFDVEGNERRMSRSLSKTVQLLWT